MRVLPSLSRSGLGLTLLALLASGAPSQQGKKGQALGRSDRQTVQTSSEMTKSVVRRTHFEWSELRLLQDSLPPGSWPVEELLRSMAQPQSAEGVMVDEVEVDGAMLRHVRRDHALPFAPETPGGTPGGVERLGGCTGFAAIPSASLSIAVHPVALSSHAQASRPFRRQA